LETGNSIAVVPFAIMNPSFQTTIAKVQAQNAATYLPKTYTAENIKGFTTQRDVLIQSLASLTNGHAEITFGGTGGNAISLEKPFSRGTVLLNTADRYAEPSVDFNTNINPVDTDVFVAMVKFYRKWMAAPSMQTLGPVEQSPGTTITTDQQIATWVTGSMGATTAHSCGTAAMMPRDIGGTVGPDLLVYGVTGLSVGDISLIPLIPATHTCATVYAIAEKVRSLHFQC
jgi:hypothetical protein